MAVVSVGQTRSAATFSVKKRLLTAVTISDKHTQDPWWSVSAGQTRSVVTVSEELESYGDYF